MSWENKDRIPVYIEEIDEEVEVFNHVSVSQHYYVNAVNGHEAFEPRISAGDDVSGRTPEFVTERIATYLWSEFAIMAEEHDIEVVDPDADGVQLV